MPSVGGAFGAKPAAATILTLGFHPFVPDPALCPLDLRELGAMQVGLFNHT